MKVSRHILALVSVLASIPVAAAAITVDSMEDFSQELSSTTTTYELTQNIDYTYSPDTAYTLPTPTRKGYSWVITSSDAENKVNLNLNGGTYVVNTSQGSNNVNKASYTLTNLNNISISNYTGSDVEMSKARIGAFFTDATGQQFHIVDNAGSLTFTNNTNITEQVVLTEKPVYTFLYSALFAQNGYNYMGLYLDRNAGHVTFSDNKTAYTCKEPYEGSTYTVVRTVPVTDENGKQVTVKDENGKETPLYEQIEEVVSGGTSAYASAYGSCIHMRSGKTSISDNGGSVTLLRNQVENAVGTAMGGAISVGGEGLAINNNGGGLELHDNHAHSTWMPEHPAISYNNQGGAISAQGVEVQICDNGLRSTQSKDSVRITDNEVRATGNSNGARGGAISVGKFTISGNKGNIQILNNRAVAEYTGTNIRETFVQGGAVYGSTSATDGFTFSINNNNGDVNIIGNYASAAANDVKVRGGFYSGPQEIIRIYSNKGDINIADNYISTAMQQTDTVDCKTSAALGGAIYSLGLSMAGNLGDIVFRGNYEQTADFTRLRSVVISSTLIDDYTRKFQISALKDKSVTFYDSVYVSNSQADISFNGGTAHQDDGLGDVVFTGATTEQDLLRIKGTAGSADEITASRTSVMEAMTHLHGGRLRVEDGAIYQGCGITVHENTGAIVRVKDATLSHEGYDVIFNAGTSLELAGANSITGNMQMLADSQLEFEYGKGLIDNAALSFSGILTLKTDSIIQLNGFDDYKGSFKLIELQGDTTQLKGWSTTKLTFVNQSGESIDPSMLVWDGMVLYYQDIAKVVNWTNATGDGKWNNNSSNWEGEGVSQSSTTLADVRFASTATEQTVTLEGDLRVADLTVQQGGQYVFAEGEEASNLSVAGTFKLEAGAALDIQLKEGLRVDTGFNSDGALKVNKITGKGDVSVTGGSLELADADEALDVEGNINITDTELRGCWAASGLSISSSTIAEDAQINLWDVSIQSTLQNDGELNLGGRVTVQIDALSIKEEGVTLYSDGQSGYSYQANRYTLATGTGSSSAAKNTEWQLQGAHTLPENAIYTYADGVLIAGGAQEKSTYWVNSEVVYDGGDKFDTAKKLVLNGGSLILSAGLQSNLTDGIRVDSAGSLKLGDGVEIFSSALTGHSVDKKVNLQGSGLLNLGNTANFNGFALGTEWTGTVKHQGIKLNDAGNINWKTDLLLNTIGQKGSTVELENCAGYFVGNEYRGANIEANIIFKRSYEGEKELVAVTIGDGFSESEDEDFVMNTFTGKISGDGILGFNKVFTGEYTGFAFTGDVEDWKGAFVMEKGKTFNLKFGGAASQINIDIRKPSVEGNDSRVLKLLLEETDSSMNLSGDITTDSIVVSNDKGVSFGGTVNTGSISAKDSKLTFNGNASITGDVDAAGLELAAEKTISAAKVTISELAKLGYNARMTADLVLTSGTELNLGSDVTLEGALTLYSGLELSGTALEEVLKLAAGESYTLFKGVTALNLEKTVTLYGMESLAAMTYGAVSDETAMDETQVSAGEYFSTLSGNKDLVLSYNSADGTVIITNSQVVPEPATATLSMLALAALAARRRRRA